MNGIRFQRHASSTKYPSAGFTIVELLIVIVVIGILAAITIVAYNGIQTRAKLSSLQSDVRNARPQLELIKTETGSYPADASSIKKSDTSTLTYTKINDGYCISASNSSSDIGSFYTTNSGLSGPGPCPVGYWPFSGNANDNTPYQNNGTVNGATLTTDRKGNANAAYGFNGTSNYIKMNNLADYSFANTTFSVSIWEKSTMSGNFVLWNGIDNCNGWGIVGGGSFWIKGVGCAQDVFTPSGVTSNKFIDNSWHQATYVVTTNTSNGALQSVTMYLDGILQSGGTLNSPNAYSPSSTLYVGMRTSDGWWAGNLGNIRIYNRALTPSEVKQIYDAEK